MGEIKSTLDLVLEKTSHLTLSEEEKRKQKQKDARSRLAGLLQRYQDAKLDISKMEEELDRLVHADQGLDESAVREEIVGHIELGGENGRWLALLQTRFRFDPTRVRSIEEDYQHAIDSAAGRRKDEIREALLRDRQISGSAVVPNLSADSTWKASLKSIAAEFNFKMAAALNETDEPSV